MTHDQALSNIQNQWPKIQHNLNILVKIRMGSLTDLGIKESYLTLRSAAADLADNECDYVTLGQAIHLGLLGDHLQ